MNNEDRVNGTQEGYVRQIFKTTNTTKHFDEQISTTANISIITYLVARKVTYYKESFGVIMLLLAHNALVLQ